MYSVMCYVHIPHIICCNLLNTLSTHWLDPGLKPILSKLGGCPMHCGRLTCTCFSLNILPGFSKWRNKTLSLSSSECSPEIAILGRDLKSCRNARRSSEGWKHDFLWSIKRLCWMGKIRENHLWDFQWQDIAPLPPTAWKLKNVTCWH